LVYFSLTVVRLQAVENVDDTLSPIADVYALKTGHLTPSQSAFFKTWEGLISLEEQDLLRFKKELWTVGAKEREAKGRCFADMVLKPGYRAPTIERAGTKGIHQFTYRFVRARGGESSLLNGHMSNGDAINVSVEPDLLALARGFIVELTPQEVVIGVDHELCVDVISMRLVALKQARGEVGGMDGSVIFRIDKDELSSGMGRIRDNLAQLFYADGDSRRLSLVVDLTPPVFTTPPPSLPPSTNHLNPNQLSALSKVLCAEDYALILGMPGTGKTTVIAALIRVLVCMGKTVLLTSYTHSAVDTILAKMVDDDFGILRLGNVDKVCFV
jgi:DNA replication ATP-dependent helicase Dna2